MIKEFQILCNCICLPIPTLLGGVGSAIVFFIPALNIDEIINLARLAVQSLFIK